MLDLDNRYVNRELSWLDFNQRVLDEANDSSIPLLERQKFLAITASNLDEFFMVRVGGLQALGKQGSTVREPAGMTSAEQLSAISKRAHEMVASQYRCLRGQLEPGLAKAGIRRLRPEQLDTQQLIALGKVFDNEVFGIFTPMAVCRKEEFPMLVNRSINICVQLKGGAGDSSDEPRFAVIPLGRPKNRFIFIQPGNTFEYITLDDLIVMHVDRFFPGEDLVQSAAFRITRDADLGVKEDLAADLLESMEAVLDARKQSACVRLELSDQANTEMRGFLQSGLEVSDDDVYLIQGPLDLATFMQLSGIPGFDQLRYESWPARPCPAIDPAENIFDVIQKEDVMLSLPYERYEPVIRFIDEAADDPDVLAIKLTLYRTSSDSPIVSALARASSNGKHVTAIVELKARFDEARNIEWAKSLEQAGVQVIYGVKGLKTHAKVCLVTRRESHGIRRYVHFGTGNYNEVTARLYTDICLLTCDNELAADAARFFNAVCGYSQPKSFGHIAIAPTELRSRIIDLIDAEIVRKRQGDSAHIMAQLNSLGDPQIIDALYKASSAGVAIDLNVRGICCLRPGVPGLSENIRVISILDRFLEHSRIVYFAHGGDDLMFISSADWMPRNLDRRTELLVPVENPMIKQRLLDILHSYRQDNVKGRIILENGSYSAPCSADGAVPHRHQENMYQLACEAERDAEQSRRTVFEPHRPAKKSNKQNAQAGKSKPAGRKPKGKTKASPKNR